MNRIYQILTLPMLLAMVFPLGACDTVEYSRKVDCSQNENKDAEVCTGKEGKRSGNSQGAEDASTGNDDDSSGAEGSSAGSTPDGDEAEVDGADPLNDGEGDPEPEGRAAPSDDTQALAFDGYCELFVGYEIDPSFEDHLANFCKSGKFSASLVKAAQDPHDGTAKVSDIPVQTVQAENLEGYSSVTVVTAGEIDVGLARLVNDVLPEASIQDIAAGPTVTTYEPGEEIEPQGGDHIGGSTVKSTTTISILGNQSFSIDLEQNVFKSDVESTSYVTQFTHLVEPTDDTRETINIRALLPLSKNKTLILTYSHITLGNRGLHELAVESVQTRSKIMLDNIFKAAE